MPSSEPIENRPAHMDRTLFVSVLLLCGFGIVMVYSSSAVLADRHLKNADWFVVRQSVYAFMGLIAMLVISRLDYRIFQKSAVIWTLLGLAFLGVLACRSPIGLTLNGAARWLKAGPITVQPAEVLKVCLVLWLSYSLNKKSLKIKSFSVGFLPHLIIPGILMAACMLQPDFGTTVVMGVLTFTLLFIAGAKLGYILLAFVVSAPIVYFLITGASYRLARVMSFLDPLSDRFGAGYQLSQSLFGYAAGGVTGLGLGDGLQKFLYLPEAHNDFIGAIIGEELGMIGIFVLLAVYLFVIGRGVVIGFRARDLFGMYVAVGISVLLGLQVLMNLAVSMGLIPTKGLNLPFVSYGGTALLIAMSTIGILLSISRYPAAGTANQMQMVPDDEGAVDAETGRSRRNVRQRMSLQGAERVS